MDIDKSENEFKVVDFQNPQYKENSHVKSAEITNGPVRIDSRNYHNTKANGNSNEHAEEESDNTEEVVESDVNILCGAYGILILALAFSFTLGSAFTVAQDTGNGGFSTGLYIVLFSVAIILQVLLQFLVLVDRCCTKCHESAPVDQTPKETERNSFDIDQKNGEPQTKVSHEGGGIHFYSRVGLVVFGVGSMIHSLLRFSIFTFGLDWALTCYSVEYFALAVLQFVFVFMQMCFIIVHHSVVINTKKVLTKFVIVHFAATHLSVWLLTVVLESFHTFSHHDSSHGEESHHDDDYEGNTTHNIHKRAASSGESSDAHSDGNITCAVVTQNPASMSSGYLFPFTIEFSLSAAAAMYIIYSQIGNTIHKHRPEPKLKLRVKKDACQGAYIGLAAGLLIFLLTLGAFGCYFVYDDLVTTQIYVITELCLLSFGLLVTIAGAVRVHKLKIIKPESMFDAYILLVTCFGVMSQDIFVVVAGAYNLSYSIIGNILVCNGVLSVVQTLIQTIFSVNSLSRRVRHEQLRTKPGRELITCLLIINLALWATYTFAADPPVSPLETFYGATAWQVIRHICRPLSIFYRFHSSVCLFEVWLHAYRGGH